MPEPEFDRYSLAYDELLKDPLRDRFTGGESIFFYERKRDLIRDFFRRTGRNTQDMRYLDIGCGKGDLISLLREDFGSTAGCDPSPGMLKHAEGVETRVQEDPSAIPFANQDFDFITAVCVYHHVPVAARQAVAREVFRVLRPGGVFAIIEHNPYNPVTRTIVSRTPVDADAILLRPAEAKELLAAAGFSPGPPEYFLYVPGGLYRRGGHVLERLLRRVPLGGQYAIFASKSGSSSID
jgi:SAM-dependent methyltransferase